MLVPKRVPPPFYSQITMAKLVIPFLLYNGITGTFGFLKFKKEITIEWES